jgi:hypothetical protein
MEACPRGDHRARVSREGGRTIKMTTLRFPADTAVGEACWLDAREPGGSSHRLAIGVVEVPDGTAISLTVRPVDEVSVPAPARTRPVPAIPLRRRRSRDRHTWRVTWQRGMPGSTFRDDRSIWGEGSYRIGSGQEAVDLEFIGGLPDRQPAGTGIPDPVRGPGRPRATRRSRPVRDRGPASPGIPLAP